MNRTLIAGLLALLAAAAPARAQQRQGTGTDTTRRASPTHHAGATGTHRAHRTDLTRLRTEAKISEDSARRVALARVPNGTVKSSELEREKGTVVYSFDIAVAGRPGVEEVLVSAIDGHVVEHQHETPAAERREAAQERREKTGSRATKASAAQRP